MSGGRCVAPQVWSCVSGIFLFWFVQASTTSTLLVFISRLLLSQVLAGDDDVYYACDTCKAKTAATLYMRVHRFPRILQLHIKRFKYAGARCLNFLHCCKLLLVLRRPAFCVGNLCDVRAGLYFEANAHLLCAAMLSFALLQTYFITHSHERTPTEMNLWVAVRA